MEDDMSKVCSIEGCDKVHYAKGYCMQHYQRMLKYGCPFFKVDRHLKVNTRKKKCSIEGCNKPHHAKGLCSMHYTRLLIHGDINTNKRPRHGYSGTREYSVWHDIRDRCNNPKNKRYYCYGGRGIKVCERWENSFLDFYSDMGDKPFDKAQIDRINNDGGYEPNNCRWISQTENMRNKGTTKLDVGKVREIRAEYKSGIKISLLAEEYGVCRGNIHAIVTNKTWAI